MKADKVPLATSPKPQRFINGRARLELPTPVQALVLCMLMECILRKTTAKLLPSLVWLVREAARTAVLVPTQ
jgi:hypothetical protein